MNIDRPELRAALREYASDSGVIVGKPGVGKSYELSLLVRALDDQRKPVYYIPIHLHAARSDADLSESLDLPSSLWDWLAEMTRRRGGAYGLLVLDGFDSARAEEERNYYLDLAHRALRELPSGWRLLVGVRTFDAARSPTLLDLFPYSAATQPASRYALPGTRCRHFHVPPLTQTEVEAVVRLNSRVEAAYASATPELRELLQIPFNLELIERLAPSDVPDLSEVSSEVQLLGLYWKYRVEEGPHANDRRVILVKLTNAMVNEKSLSVRKDSLYEHGWSREWDELLSSEVLASDERGLRVSYRHAILFDFAVARLLIEDDPTLLEQFVLADPARPVFLRPSLAYHLTWLWYEDRDNFWRVFWHMLRSVDARLRLFARLLPTSVALTETRLAGDVRPLLEKMVAGDGLAREGFYRLVQAYNALQPGRDDIWVGVMELVAGIGDALDAKAVWGTATITSDILARAEKKADTECRRACGAIGRELLDWALKHRAENRDWVDSFAPLRVLPLVLKTFDTHTAGSHDLVQRVLALLTEEGFPIQYFWILAEHIDHIWPSDPDVVAEIYLRIFTQQEPSEQKTAFASSVVLPMSSTRRQDYDMVQYVLAGKFSKFLEAAPLVAARTAIDCLNAAILIEHVVPYLTAGTKVSDLESEEFQFLSGKARFLSDMSYIWDDSYGTSKQEEMANSLFNVLGNVAGNPPSVERLDDMLKLFRDRAIWAYFWRKLLAVGAQQPSVYKDRLYELCVAEPILRSSETLEPLGGFLQTAARLWSERQVEAVELAILRLPEGNVERDDTAHWEHWRNRLLARIPQDMLRTDEGRKLRAEMESTGTVPDNEPLFRTTTVSGGEVTDEHWVEHLGAKPGEPENKRLLELGKPLDRWAREWNNKKPDSGARKAAIGLGNAAREALGATKGADDSVRRIVWTHLASVCEAMSRADDLADDEFQACRGTLLEAARLQTEGRSDKDDAQYNFPGWGGTAQSEAAIGLIWLASRKPDDEMLQAIRTLALEKHANVRSPTIHYLARLREKSPDFFWKLLHDIADVEKNDQMLGALCSQLWPAAAEEPEKAAAILVQLGSKFSTAGSRSSFVEHFVPAVMWLAIARNEPSATGICTMWTSDALSYAPLLSRATLDAMSFVTPKIVCDSRREADVERAKGWVLEAIDAASSGLTQVRAQASGQLNEEQQQLYREVYGVFEHVVRRVFFDSGVFQHRSKDDEPVTPKQQKVYYPAVKPLLESVLDHTEASKGGILLGQVAHYFMQYLNGVLILDPPGVLHMAVRVVANSVDAGYNFDSLAVSEVVKLVEAILADHREIVQGGQGLDDILALLDAFANAGWPDANRLVWRLDDIFR